MRESHRIVRPRREAQTEDRPVRRSKLGPNDIKVSFVVRRKSDGTVEVDGRSVRFKPLVTFVTAEKCVYAIEHWSKVVARGMRLDTKIAPKVTEAVENAGVKLVETAAGMLFERFFGNGRGAQ